MKKIILKFSFLISAFIIGFLTLGNSFDAFATTSIVDNDALSDAPGSNQSSGTWTWGSGSGNYNNDYRLKSGASGSYAWLFDVKNKSVTYYVYLANPKFNNIGTCYQLGEYGWNIFINQNTAPAGWNRLESWQQEYNIALIINGSRSSSTGSMGADAAKVTY